MLNRLIGSLVLTVVVSTSYVFGEQSNHVLVGKVDAVSDASPVLLIDTGDSKVLLGDFVVCMGDDGAVWAGEVFFVQEHKAGVRNHLNSSSGIDRKKLVGNPALIVSDKSIGAKRIELPGSVYRVARVDSVLPGGDRVWIDRGRRSGWKINDPVYLGRGSEVVGWGRIVEVDDDVALVRLERQGGVIRWPARGDVAEQIGGDDGSYPLRSRVMVRGDNEITLAGSAESGFAFGDRLELFHKGEYAGFAKMTKAGDLLYAEVIASFQKSPVEPADVVVTRRGRQVSGRIFRLEPDYCLVTLGADDGIVDGQTLIAQSADSKFVRLSVRNVYPDHCGAVVVDRQQDAVPLSLWTPVTTISAGQVEREQLIEVENIKNTCLRWLFTAELPIGVDVGTVVGFGAGDNRLGVVIENRKGLATLVSLDSLHRDVPGEMNVDKG